MKRRFEVLDIFRGLFASMVFMFHLNHFANTPIINNAFFINSDLFVDFFFLLSGFVIAYNYHSIATIRDFKSFYIKRFLRIYPLHLVMLLAFLAIEFIKTLLASHIQVNNLNNPGNNIYTFFSSLLLLNSIKVFNVKDVSWNVVSWSISAEMIAYLVFGSALLFISKLKLQKYCNYLYTAIILTAIITLIHFTGAYRLVYSFDFGFLRGIIGFFIGVICCNAFLSANSLLFPLKSSLFTIAEIASLILIGYFIYNRADYKNEALLYEGLFCISIFIFSFEKGIVSVLLKKIKPLHTIGKYSYSIYMTHTLLISLFNVLFIRILKFSPSSYAYLFLVNYLIIYFVAGWTFKNIEMRFNYKSKKATKPIVSNQQLSPIASQLSPANS